MFGGDSSAPPSQSSYESETEQSQPSVDGDASPPSAQPPTSDRHAAGTETGGDDDLSTNSESDGDESDEEMSTRPNRFKGARAVWLSHTAADRQIATSLEQIQNKDLSAHLYNAHSLNRRVRRPAGDLERLKNWQKRDKWLKQETELEYTDPPGGTQTEFVAPKDWAAWPLQTIPTPGEQPSEHTRSERDQWVISGTDARDAGHELREEMLATFMHLAKERWNARDMEEVSTRERDRLKQSRSRSRSRSIRSVRSTSRSDVRMKDDDDKQTDGAESHGEQERVISKGGRKPAPELFLTPAFLADDEKAMSILEPHINFILSGLDDLAYAVRRTRLNHFEQRGKKKKSSQSKVTSDADSGELSTRAPSRAQSRSGTGREQSTRLEFHGTSTKGNLAARKARLKAQDNASSGDTDSSSDSSFDIDTINKVPVSRTPSRPRSRASGRKSSASRDATWKAGLIDWSEVLGLAAAQGWNECALSRAAQRCAALFGESMSLVPLEESLAAKPSLVPVQYTPSTVTAPDALSAKQYMPPKRPVFRSGTLRCPHVDCYGHEKDFGGTWRVVEHIIRTHKYDPRTNDSDNEDRMVGGVHIDGFLQPIPAQRGWQKKGRSRASSGQGKREMEMKEDLDGGDAMIMDSD